MEHEGFRISPVEDFSIFAGFSCLSPDDTDRDLDEFITCDAERHYQDKIAVTYQFQSAAACEKSLMPIGFATLQNDAITNPNPADLPAVCQAYNYKAFPAVKIGRFGIHLDLQRQSFGSLFLYMLKVLLTTDNRTGCRYITVDARRDKANKVNVTGFYKRNQFAVLPCLPKTSTYVPMYFDLINFRA
ncbi:hypothetical protein V6C53_15160 [Desulfocurvibacter africanus]|uniref:hypothetical protein n=1 Tax=Desulfocurvibacter africanus TaxID=873 RepID=UPI002FD90CF0